MSPAACDLKGSGPGRYTFPTLLLLTRFCVSFHILHCTVHAHPSSVSPVIVTHRVTDQRAYMHPTLHRVSGTKQSEAKETLDVVDSVVKKAVTAAVPSRPEAIGAGCKGALTYTKVFDH